MSYLREHLKAIEGQRALFRATFSRFDHRSSRGYMVPTALFVDVRNEQGFEVCDHIWMRRGKQVNDLRLEEGDQVEFFATSAGYWSGYHDNRHYNYGLKFPTKLRKVDAPRPTDPAQLLFAIS